MATAVLLLGPQGLGLLASSEAAMQQPAMMSDLGVSAWTVAALRVR